MIRPNNKGFSLVEMLVAMAVLAIVMGEVFMVMSNSSRLYLNGSNEVALQSEAQQIILQLEDLMIDAQVSINSTYSPSLSSDSVIEIQSTPTKTYEIIFDKDDLADPYGTLSMIVSDATGWVELPLADYVESISLNMTNLSSNNIVTLNIAMRNDKYTYQTSQDIFLRNQLGTGNMKRGKLNSTNNVNGLDVLRFRNYNLMDVFFDDINEYEAQFGAPDSYKFNWSSDTLTKKDSYNRYASQYYSIVGSSLRPSEFTNKSFDLEIGMDVEFELVCYADRGGVLSEVSTVRVSTQKVSIGMGLDHTNTSHPYGYGIVFPSTENSSDYYSVIPFQGIDASMCSKITFQTMVYHPSFTDGKKQFDSMEFTINPVGSFDMKNAHSGQVCLGGFGIPGFSDNQSALTDSYGFGSDKFSNSIKVYTSRMLNPTVYFGLVDVGAFMGVHVEMQYNVSGTHVISLPYDFYFVPQGNIYTLSEEQKEDYLKNLWDLIYAFAG